jgi:Terminase DNA packaging enzyme.
MSKNDIEDDYEYARSQYYDLAEKGNEAIDLMLELARESEHPRAFEVLAGMLKQNAELADKLMDLQKKKKDINKIDTPRLDAPVTNNNLFVGSTTELQKMLAAKMRDVEPHDERD